MGESGQPGQRLERLEAIEAIRQLAQRYGHCVDTRDLDGLLDLFHADTRAVVQGEFERLLKEPARTIHFVGNHVVEFDTVHEDRARGWVYCRAERELADGWVATMLRYSDRYQRSDGRWLIRGRTIEPWYTTEQP